MTGSGFGYFLEPQNIVQKISYYGYEESGSRQLRLISTSNQMAIFKGTLSVYWSYQQDRAAHNWTKNEVTRY